MEKRAILAFGLILVVWVLYYSPFYQESILGRQDTSLPSTKETATPTRSTQRKPDETPASQVPQAPHVSQEQPQTPQMSSTEADRRFDNWDREVKLMSLPIDSTAVSREIIVESDLFRGVFNTHGAVISSWRLKEYEGVETPWVELIPDDRNGGPDILLTSEDGIIDFSQVVFESTDNNMTLSDARPNRTLEFKYVSPSGLGLVKRFTFANDDYAFNVDVEIIGGNHTPLGNKYFIRWGGGLRVTEPDRQRDLSSFRAFRLVGDEVEEQDIGDSEPVSDPLSGTTHWVGVRSKYFFAGVVPTERAAVGSRLSGRPITDDSVSDRQIAAELEMELIPNITDRYLIYLGPVDYDLLARYDRRLEDVVDLGWAIIKPISRIILQSLVWLHQWISNYGLVIVVLSVIVKVLLYPLTYKSMMATQGMQKLQPKIEELKTKYKNDSPKLNKEMMKLYKDQGVNPIGGCLPMLLQMPILYSLYAIFSSTIELRRAPLGWWIEDLSQKDPWYILPILMGLTMLLQSKMTMKDPRQATFVYMMPIVLFIFMKDLPSGLILYWTMVNILTILQQYMQNRFLPTSPVSS